MTHVALLSTESKTNYAAPYAPSPSISLGGLNPLVAAAMPLLLLLIKFKNLQNHNNVTDLRQRVIEEIRAFEARAKALQCSPRLILAARYCICTALDEIVLLTSWGSDSIWSQQTLLSTIHRETWGGERFFIILEKMAEEPKQNLPLLELLYIILSLGFEGKYYNEEKTVREEIRHRLFRLIMLHREEPNRKLSPSLKTVSKGKIEIKPLIPKWKIAAGTAAILFTLALVFNIATYFAGRKILQELIDIDQLTSTLITAPAVPANKSVVKHTKNNHQHHVIQEDNA